MKKKTGKAKYRLSAVTIVVICIAALLVFAYFILLSEEHGFFPGKQISIMIGAQSIRKESGEKELTLEEYDFHDGKYELDFTLKDGRKVDIYVDGFQVVGGGYFNRYLEDRTTEELFSKSVAQIIAKGDYGDAELFSCNTDIKISLENSSQKNDFTVTENVRREIRKCNLTVEFLGERKTFDEYKSFVYKVVEQLRNNNMTPLSMQIFYSRKAEGDEESSVLEYESKVDRKQFVYDEYLLSQSRNTHYMVEVPEDTAKKFKANRIIKNVYTAVIVGIIVVSVTFLLVRKEKRRKKSFDAQNKQ